MTSWPWWVPWLLLIGVIALIALGRAIARAVRRAGGEPPAPTAAPR